MRGLSLTQPWAQLVADGRKGWETRGWTTGYRGLVAIHATGRMTADDVEFAVEQGYNPRALPLGAIVAVARIAGVLEASVAERTIRDTMPEADAERELAVGDFSPGRYAWELADVRAVPAIPIRGALGLWDVPSDIVIRLRLDAGLAGR